MIYGKLKIEVFKLAGQCDNKFYAFIDNMLDYDIMPSKYSAIVLKRIKKAYYLQAFFNV